MKRPSTAIIVLLLSSRHSLSAALDLASSQTEFMCFDAVVLAGAYHGHARNEWF
jgi:hypothetical protein